jgi:hypothetical protein
MKSEKKQTTKKLSPPTHKNFLCPENLKDKLKNRRQKDESMLASFSK